MKIVLVSLLVAFAATDSLADKLQFRCVSPRKKNLKYNEADSSSAVAVKSAGGCGKGSIQKPEWLCIQDAVCSKVDFENTRLLAGAYNRMVEAYLNEKKAAEQEKREVKSPQLSAELRKKLKRYLVSDDDIGALMRHIVKANVKKMNHRDFDELPYALQYALINRAELGPLPAKVTCKAVERPEYNDESRRHYKAACPKADECRRQVYYDPVPVTIVGADDIVSIQEPALEEDFEDAKKAFKGEAVNE